MLDLLEDRMLLSDDSHGSRVTFVSDTVILSLILRF